MANRFIDTALYDKEWFMNLTPSEKAAYYFLLSKCDSVGVWSPNFKLANIQIGENIEWETFPEKCNDNIIILENGKWWLIDFCTFQYGELDENSLSKPIISYIKQLKKHDLWNEYQRVSKGYTKGIHTHKEKEKEKEKEKSNDVQEIIDSYPKCCPVKNDRLYPDSKDNRKKINKLLEKYSKDEIIKKINIYLTEKKNSNSYLHSFKNMLELIPEINENIEVEQKPKVDFSDMPDTAGKALWEL